MGRGQVPSFLRGRFNRGRSFNTPPPHLFATLRQGRDKVTLLSPEGIACAGDILDRMNIPQEEVSILLINGFHHKPESEVKDGDIVALFPPVGGG